MDHPEIREVLNDFLSSVLAAKPVSQSSSLVVTNKNHFEIYRTTFSFTRKSISIHSTQHQKKRSHLSSLVHQALVRTHLFNKSSPNGKVSSKRREVTRLDQRRPSSSQERITYSFLKKNLLASKPTKISSSTLRLTVMNTELVKLN
jgi:hypothetical protein